MEAPLHADDPLAFEGAVDELPDVSLNRGDGESFDLAVGQSPDNIDAVVREEAEAGAEDETNLWFKVGQFYG